MRYLWSMLMLLLTAGTAEATTLYASHIGTAAAPCSNNASASTRCSVVTALTAAAAGDTVSLFSGTLASPVIYTGANYMLVPPTGKSGTSGNPITVTAETDGGVIFDGQFQRTPVFLTDSNWWVLEGFNARNGSGGVVRLIGSTSSNGSSDNIIRRVVAWDTQIQSNVHVFSVVYNSQRNLFEDVAGFGTGRKVFASSFSTPTDYAVGQGTTCRRCWFRWEGNTYYGNRMGITDSYKSDGTTLENVLVTFDGISVPQNYTENCVAPPCNSITNFNFVTAVGALGHDGNDGRANNCVNVRVVGSIAYLKSTSLARLNQAVLQRDFSCGHLTDVVSFVPTTLSPPLGTSTTASSIKAFTLLPGTTSPGTTDLTADHITGISPASPVNNTGSPWVVTNANTGATVADVNNIWTNTGTGANMCWRYVDRVRQDGTPLWPWPMNERIKVATGTQAGAYSGTCPTCTGTLPRTRTQVDVTADMEAIFGTIPAACRNDNSEEPFPDFTGYPTHGQITAFSSSGTPPVGFAKLGSGGNWTESGGVASAATSFGIIYYDSLLQPNQEAWAEITTIPTTALPFFINFLITDNNNRYRAALYNNASTNDDTIIVDKIVAGVTTTLASISLGRDIASGDRLGIRVTDTVIEVGYYANWSGTTEWKLVGTATATSAPAQSYIGMAAASPVTVTQFGGGADAPNDTTAPTAPSNLSVTPQTFISLDLTWTASTDAVGVTEYRIYRGTAADCADCAVIGTNTTNTYTDVTATQGTTHYYRVTARDAALNESAASSIVSGRVPDGAAYVGTSGRLR